MKKTGTKDQALLTNHVHPSPPRWQRCSLCTTSQTCLSLVGSLPSSHATGKQKDRGLAEAGVVQYALLLCVGKSCG
uniref:Uncharacterized protein n=1 Tax=Mesocestoides corti TaxID=53468 RepID=A0A5K3F4J1_MESCO